MKFGKEFASQMVPEWQEAYMDYASLKQLLKDMSILYPNRNGPGPSPGPSRKPGMRRRLSLYRAFSGLTTRIGTSPRISPKNKNDDDGDDNEDEEVILVTAVEGEGSYYETKFLMSSDESGEKELLFFKKLDEEFNKVIKFYMEKVKGVKMEAEEMNKQMDALIALRVRVDKPFQGFINGDQPIHVYSSSSSSPTKVVGKQVRPHMDAIQEVDTDSESVISSKKSEVLGFRPAPLEVLHNVKINIDPETPVSTMKNVLKFSNGLSYSKVELTKAEERMKKALVEFYKKLSLIKNYSFLNQLAFSKIMKKYDKITSRNASKSYLKMVDDSYLGNSDEVAKLIAKVESAFIKHFSNGNRRKGMKQLRPQAKKRERHRVTFFLGLFTGCSIALIVAIVIIIRMRNILESKDRDKYMQNIFPLYSFFGFIVLHMIMYAGAVYFWKRYRVNYSFIFGFKQGTELHYREVLLLASGLSVLALAAVISHLDMEIDSKSDGYKISQEVVPLCLVTILLSIIFCPFNVMYRSSRFFLIRCAWHCLCAPLYKVKLPDFFLADQLTSQIQAFRSLLFYVFYYCWGDVQKRENKFEEDKIYKILFIVVAIIPFWARFLQCVRRFFEEKDSMQGLNGLKYFSTIVALVMRTLYSQKKGVTWLVLASVSSGVTTIANTYWDIVIDWGLLIRKARYPWLRDKLLVPHKSVYFVAIVVNILLRLVWMQLVLNFNETSFLHTKAFISIVATLEILRRGIWNFFRLENEHLNNVGKYRAFKSVPLPFNYNQDKSL